MDIYCCFSYLSIPHTITLIKQNSEQNCLIITSNREIEKFFSVFFNSITIDFIPSFSYTISGLKYLTLLPWLIIRITIMKIKVWSYYKNLTNNNVYFFFNAAAHSQAWLIYKLSKDNNIYYQEDINLSNYPIANGFYLFLSKLFIRLMYREEVEPINQGNGLISYKIRNNFLKKINAINLNLTIDYKNLSSEMKIRMKLPQSSILLLTNYMPEHGVSIEDHIKANDKLINALINHNYNPHFKLHSRAITKYSSENILFEVPKYYPASLLLYYHAFIGYVSSALIEAANNNILSISLIDYIPSYNEARKKYMKEFLINNLFPSKEIKFPKTIDEIILILQKANKDYQF